MECFDKIGKIKPREWNYWIDLADSYYDLGDYLKALYCPKKALHMKGKMDKATFKDLFKFIIDVESIR